MCLGDVMCALVGDVCALVDHVCALVGDVMCVPWWVM